jgi:hypothetical protein
MPGTSHKWVRGLHAYATVATWDDIADRLRARYGRIVTQAEFSVAVASADDKARLMTMVDRLRVA